MKLGDTQKQKLHVRCGRMVEAQRAISSLTLITFETRFACSRASPYQGKETARAVRRAARARLEIVKRSDTAKGFVVLQKRWIVERTFGWLGRCRRLAKDFEALASTHLAFVQLAMIRLMMSRIARASQTS